MFGHSGRSRRDTRPRRRLRGKGLVGDLSIRWPELIAFKRGFTDPVPASREESYAKNGIDAYHGRARFTGRTTIEVAGESLDAAHVLIAAGADPVALGIPGEEHLITSDEFFALETLPRRIVLLGGGYIAAELSHLAALAGAEGTVLEQGERLLVPFDADLVDWLMNALAAHDIEVRTRTKVEAIEQTAGGFRVRASASGKTIHVDADLVVHAAGRAPALEALALQAADIAEEEGRLKLNEYLQSVSNPAVYAAGDAAQKGPPLTPVASHDANVIAANILEGNRRTPDYTSVPSVAFTIPPIAAVGLGEAQAREQRRKFRVNCQRGSDWYIARQAAEPTYGFKVLIEEETDRVLGAHLVGPHADEVVNLFALAIRHGLTAPNRRATMFAYPTGASDIGYML